MKLTAQVDCGDGAVMTISHPKAVADGSVSWRLRYSHPYDVRMIAASIIDSYDYLLSDAITQAEAIRRLRLLRSARSAALQEVHE